MKKAIFLTAAASLTMATPSITLEEYRKLMILQNALALRADDASDDAFFRVGGGGARPSLDDEVDDEFFRVGGGAPRPRFDDEVDDEFFHVHNTHAPSPWGNMADDEQDSELFRVIGGGVRPRFDDEAQDNNLIHFNTGGFGMVRDDEAQDNNLIVDKIKTGYYHATNWAVMNHDKIHRYGNMLGNGLMNPTWDDEVDNEFFRVGGGGARPSLDDEVDDEFFRVGGGAPRPRFDDEAQDNNLIIDKLKTGYYHATNWAVMNHDKIHRYGNMLGNGLMNPTWDDELMLVKKKKKTPQTPQPAQDGESAPAPAPQKHKKKGGKFRPVPQPQPQPQPEVQADNTLFDLGALLDDAEY